ncbi:Enoyl-CoA hydratase/isomerase [Chondrus crispus]|uniref:Enoyl-CoA hydratase/isomerase n=1 Tax=Chondrus crispus TaxID=2769 RepID=R7QGF8_CHOCR|nr:Enoyl-CoA hydratase/isomerase [Chondrus crispus]CDF37612.1 Enoyl-CoA hydratase/isomerase [Chondrus crispus]|eukprot:XP_005717483.1 Enoyl-CoA hydratase/isomerase [Chondrus crispus]
MTQASQITIEKIDSSIAILSISNPPYGFMDDTTEKELVLALDSLDADKNVSVVVLTGGQPDVFIRHYDTLVLEARGRQMAARGLKFDLKRPVPEVGIHRVLRQIENSSSTFIAAINGEAMGGGFELALACDLRIAQAGEYSIGLPEVNLGLLPGAGGTQRLTRLVGKAKALELMLMGDTLRPREARSYGLVNDVVNEPVLPVATQLARVIASKPANARARIKYLIHRAQTSDQTTGFAEERTLFCDLMGK